MVLVAAVVVVDHPCYWCCRCYVLFVVAATACAVFVRFVLDVLVDVVGGVVD